MLQRCAASDARCAPRESVLIPSPLEVASPVVLARERAAALVPQEPVLAPPLLHELVLDGA